MERAKAVEQFHRIKRAYEILSDNKERQSYDTRSNREFKLTFGYIAHHEDSHK